MTARDPIGRLLEEHAEIMAGLEPLRDIVRRAAEPGSPATRSALDRVGRVIHERLFLHARKEDEGLFPAIEQALASTAGPTAVMRAEHVDIHDQALRFRETLRELNAVEHPAIVTGATSRGDLASGRGSAEELRATAGRLLDLVDAHFHKEEAILFPMARGLLSESALGAVAERMDAMEAAAGTGR